MSGILVKVAILLVSGAIFGIGEFGMYTALDELKNAKKEKLANKKEIKEEDVVDSNLETQKA